MRRIGMTKLNKDTNKAYAKNMLSFDVLTGLDYADASVVALYPATAGFIGHEEPSDGRLRYGP